MHMYAIPVHRVSKLVKEFDRLNRKAVKFGMPMIEVIFGETEIRTVNGIDFECVSMSVEGEAPTHAGWTFAAKLVVEDQGNMIYSMTSEPIPVYYHNSNNCEHCGYVRKRNETYVLKHVDGTYIQVGSTCVKDFLNIDPSNLLAMASVLVELDILCKDAEHFDGGKAPAIIRLRGFIATTIAVIEKHGWISKGKAAEKELQPTVSRVLDAIYGLTAVDTPTDAQLAKADAIIEYVASVPGDEEYVHNISLIARNGYCKDATAGYAASMVSFYDRAFAVEEIKSTGYVGEVGKRTYFQVIAERAFPFSGQYGDGYINKMRLETGEVLVWSTSKKLEQGTRYLLKGTVKGHSEFRGEKQTVLSRCVIEA